MVILFLSVHNHFLLLAGGFYPCHLFAVFLVCMQMNKTLSYRILLKWCLNLFSPLTSTELQSPN